MRLIYQLDLSAGRTKALALLNVDVTKEVYVSQSGELTVSGRILRITGSPLAEKVTRLDRLQLKPTKGLITAGSVVIRGSGKYANVEAGASVSKDWAKLDAIVAAITVTDEVIAKLIKSARVTGRARLYRIEQDSVVVPVPPAPVDPGRRQVLILGNTRTWHEMSARDHAHLVFDLGRADWMGIELHGLDPASVKNPGDMERWTMQCIDRAALHVAECRNRGKRLFMYWTNTNLADQDEMDVNGHKRCLAHAEKMFGGWSGIHVMPHNEDDPMKPGVRDFLRRYFFEKLDAGATVLFQEKHGDAVWNEFHPFTTKQYAAKVPKAWQNIIATDNNESMAESSDGAFANNRPNGAKAAKVVKAILKHGCSAHLYNNYPSAMNDKLAEFYLQCGLAWWGALDGPTRTDTDAVDITDVTNVGKNGLRGIGTAPITKKLVSAKWSGSSISYKVEPNPLGWNASASPIGGNIDQRLILAWVKNGKVYCGHFDWNRPGRTSHDTKNLYNGYLTPPRDVDAFYLVLANDWSGRGMERTNVVRIEGAFPS